MSCFLVLFFLFSECLFAFLSVVWLVVRFCLCTLGSFCVFSCLIPNLGPSPLTLKRGPRLVGCSKDKEDHLAVFFFARLPKEALGLKHPPKLWSVPPKQHKTTEPKPVKP